MKNNFLFIIAIVSIIALSNNDLCAQLKVRGDNGKTIIGLEPDESPLIYVEDFDEILSASIFGKGDTYRSGSKLSFGDFGRKERWGWNVFVGEYMDFDSDQLWLHGKYGFHYTYGRADLDQTILSFDIQKDKCLHVYTELFVHGVKLLADEEAQQNSRKIESPIDRINTISGITFELKPYTHIAQNHTSSETVATDLSPKEEEDMLFFDNLRNELSNDMPTKNGFNAVEFAEHFPELVEKDGLGNTYIDYTGLIPVLVEAIKEQSRVMTAQSIKIKEMELMADANTLSSVDSNSGSFSTKSTLDSNDVDRITANAFLYQNTPNPFNTTTEIKYFLPEGATNSNIYVFNMQGNLLLTFNLANNGFGTIEINSSSLSAGMYIYTLTINGKEVESKRMILTK